LKATDAATGGELPASAFVTAKPAMASLDVTSPATACPADVSPIAKAARHDPAQQASVRAQQSTIYAQQAQIQSLESRLAKVEAALAGVSATAGQ